MIPWALTGFPLPLEEKHPHSILFPSPCLTVGTVFFGLYASPFFLQTYSASIRPNNSNFVSSEQRTVDQKLGSCFRSPGESPEVSSWEAASSEAYVHGDLCARLTRWWTMTSNATGMEGDTKTIIDSWTLFRMGWVSVWVGTGHSGSAGQSQLCRIRLQTQIAAVVPGMFWPVCLCTVHSEEVEHIKLEELESQHLEQIQIHFHH